MNAPHTRKSLVKGERFMRYVWRAWVCLHIWEGSRVLNPALKKHLWSLFQQDRRCSWHRMDMGSKSDLYELLNKDFRQKIIIYSAADQRPLWWLFSNPGWLRWAAAKSSTLQTDTRGQVVMARLWIYGSLKIEHKTFWNKSQSGSW